MQQPSHDNSAATGLSHKRQQWEERRERLLERFGSATRNQQSARLRRLYRQLTLLNEALRLLEELAALQPEAEAKPGRPHYAVSSLFLHSCFQELTADAKEQFFFITGPEISGTLVLNQKISFVHERRSATGVTGDTRATHRLLIMLERFRHRLLGHAHSHPGTGPEATRPSGIDEAFQRRLEAAGHVGLAAIFSRDGWVRFFRLDQAVDIAIFGQGVEQHEPNLYKLTEIDQLDGGGSAGRP